MKTPRRSVFTVDYTYLKQSVSKSCFYLYHLEVAARPANNKTAKDSAKKFWNIFSGSVGVGFSAASVQQGGRKLKKGPTI